MPNVLVIPDAHAHPKYDNKRFAALGNFIAETRPDDIVCLGDWYDMPSLSSWDRGKVQFEGRRYKDDIEAGQDANRQLRKPVEKLQNGQRRHRHKVYNPFWHFLRGNHEQRVDRALASEPHLIGTLKQEHTIPEGWVPYQYLDKLYLFGVAFTHNFVNANGRDIGGKNHARMLLGQHMSTVVGHSHKRDFAEDPLPDGRKIFSLVAGCFTHPDYLEDWNRGTKQFEWHGVTLLEGLSNGMATGIRFIDQATIEGRYS